MRWQVIRANLLEAASVKSTSDLIAVGKNRVFNKNYGWGKFIHFFSCSRSKGRVEEIFQRMKDQINAIDEKRVTYFHHLGRDLRGQRYSPIDKEKAEKELLQFCFYMKPLMRDVIKGTESPYLDLLGSNREEWKQAFSLIRLFQRIKNLEITIKTPIPYHSMIKVASCKPLKATEQEQMNQWLISLGKSLSQKLPSFRGPVKCNYGKIRFLHRLLRDLVTMFNEVLRSKTCALTVLEAYIQEHGCPEFNYPDAKHIKWAKSLGPGSKISAGGIQYEIKKVLETGHAIVFALKGHPDLEFVVDRNESIGCHKDYTTDLHHCGIIRAKQIALEEKGRGTIQERVVYSLEDYPEQNAIIELIRGLHRLPYTPEPLTPKTFGFNYQGEMRAKHLLYAGNKNLVALEKFVYEISHDAQGDFNHPLYNSIMKKSGLINDIYRKFLK